LNTLTSLIAEDQDKAVNFVRDFSDLYRYILKSQEREISTLEDELHATNIYLKLQKERFEDKLQPQINISSNKMKTYLPTLTLQMLVENCIKHNIIGQSKPLHINIFTENGRLIVQNNLQKKNTAPFSTGLGLKNIKKRYDFLSNEGVEVIETEEHFKVVLPLLKMQQG
jgi:LytS/YehU family sensor histidine kinase